MEAEAYRAIGGWLRYEEHPVHGFDRGRAYGMAILNMLSSSRVDTQMIIHTTSLHKYYVEKQLRTGWFAGYGHVAEMTVGQAKTVRRLFVIEQQFCEGILGGVMGSY